MYEIPEIEPGQAIVYYYCVYNVNINGCLFSDIMYIGQTMYPKKRHHDHMTHAKSRCPVDNLLRTHHFDYGVLWIGNKEDADITEKKYIELYCTLFPFGFNFESGGRSGGNKEISEKTRIKKQNSPKNKPIIQYELDGTYVKTWSSIRGACRELGYKKGASGPICHAASGRGRYKSAYGYIWKYADDVSDIYNLKIPKQRYIHYLDDGTIKEYDSISDASKDTGLKESSISSYCRSNRPKTKWKVIYE